MAYVMPDTGTVDLNGDGVITAADATYIGYPETPRMIYGFSGFLNYKNFEFSFCILKALANVLSS